MQRGASAPRQRVEKHAFPERVIRDDDLIDLEPVIRDAVLLAMPLAPLCQTDCAGLCITCGENLNDVPDHAHEEIDPRWATLANLKDLIEE